jgi:cytochrome c peroxidase
VGKWLYIPLLLIKVLLLGCGQDKSNCAHIESYQKNLDEYAKNKEIIAFGKALFFDPILSVTETVSCASCHHPNKAFTDGNKLPIGIHDRTASRNSPTLVNLAIHPYFMLDGGNATLEIQALTPLRDTNEMGSDIGELITKLRTHPTYNAQAKALFDREMDPYVLTRALAAFQKAIISFDSPFDRWYYWQDEQAISEEAKKGFKLFGEQLNCVGCHPPPYFTTFAFENNGHFSDYTDLGRYMVTGDSSDKAKFKIPTLRNIGLTAPYMHNGEVATLREVIENYAIGGHPYPTKSEAIQPFSITEDEKDDLLRFFESLTDTSFIEKLNLTNH